MGRQFSEDVVVSQGLKSRENTIQICFITKAIIVLFAANFSPRFIKNDYRKFQFDVILRSSLKSILCYFLPKEFSGIYNEYSKVDYVIVEGITMHMSYIVGWMVYGRGKSLKVRVKYI